MLKPKKFDSLFRKIEKGGAKPSPSSAPTPKELMKSLPEARRSGLDWATFTR